LRSICDSASSSRSCATSPCGPAPAVSAPAAVARTPAGAGRQAGLHARPASREGGNGSKGAGRRGPRLELLDLAVQELLALPAAARAAARGAAAAADAAAAATRDAHGPLVLAELRFGEGLQRADLRVGSVDVQQRPARARHHVAQRVAEQRDVRAERLLHRVP
jgi:hypothetical protein